MGPPVRSAEHHGTPVCPCNVHSPRAAWNRRTRAPRGRGHARRSKPTPPPAAAQARTWASAKRRCRASASRRCNQSERQRRAPLPPRRASSSAARFFHKCSNRFVADRHPAHSCENQQTPDSNPCVASAAQRATFPRSACSFASARVQGARGNRRRICWPRRAACPQLRWVTALFHTHQKKSRPVAGTIIVKFLAISLGGFGWLEFL